MAEMALALSEKFSQDDAVAIRTALNRHLQVGEPTRVRQRSFDPPSFIQLLGAAAAWQILLKPAAAFLRAFFGTLGKKTAEAAWDGAQQWKNNRDLRPLSDVATALVAAADRVGGNVKICVGLNVPDDYCGTVISTDSRDPMEVARILSAFVVRAERISDIVQSAIERGDAPVGDVLVELAKDGGMTIRWHAGVDFKTYEERIP